MMQWLCQAAHGAWACMILDGPIPSSLEDQINAGDAKEIKKALREIERQAKRSKPDDMSDENPLVHGNFYGPEERKR